MQPITDQYPGELVERARKIKLLITDVDGVLTDGGIIYDDNGLEYKKFNVKDGQIMKLLTGAGIKVGAITGRKSEVVKYRMEQMGMDFHYHGIKDKLATFSQVVKDQACKPEEVAYLGDDIIDIPILRSCGLAGCPSDAPAYVQAYAHWVSQRPGGRGVFRELADLILAAQDKFESALEDYITQYQNHS